MFGSLISTPEVKPAEKEPKIKPKESPIIVPKRNPFTPRKPRRILAPIPKA